MAEPLVIYCRIQCVCYNTLLCIRFPSGIQRKFGVWWGRREVIQWRQQWIVSVFFKDVGQKSEW